MYRITKKIKFEAGHRLMLHTGPCRNVHGHSYLVEVTFEALDLNKNGFVLDFAEFAELKRWIKDRWDHALLLNDQESVEFSTALQDPKVFSKLFWFHNEEPSAENMARYLYKMIESKRVKWFGLTEGTYPRLLSVVVHETETGRAEYRED